MTTVHAWGSQRWNGERWHCLPYLDGPLKGATALFGFWPPEQVPAELDGGYRLAPGGGGYTLAPPSGGYMLDR
jgi:hypothetical protein